MILTARKARRHARQLLLDRAVEVRAAFIVAGRQPPADPRRTRVAPLSEAQLAARRAEALYMQAAAALPARDRLARTLADQWVEVAHLALHRNHLGFQTAEDVAWRFLRQLPAGRCPRSAPRAVRASANAVPPGDWLLSWQDEVQALVRLMRSIWAVGPPARRQ